MKTNMKAKLMLLVIVLTTLSNTKLFGQTNKLKADNIKYVALTGQLEADAESQISYFATHKDEDNRPDIVSIWFDMKVISAMVDLLKSEKDASGNFKADGIRIYYTAAAGTPYLKTSVVLVSTKTETPRRPGQSTHRDYYDHDSTKALFSINAATRNGELRNDNCDGGARLYTRGGGTRVPCDPNNPNDVPVSVAENMVIRNKNHKHTINTISEWLPR